MQSLQEPIGSGLGPRATAAEVLRHRDLSACRAIVTGGHSGLGLETVRALATAGADVVIASRHPDQAVAALSRLGRVRGEALDLADLDTVQACARRIADTGDRIDMLINNAGIMACPETRVGAGWEAQFAVNHLGHFAFTLGLLPVLGEGSRVVAVSSLGHHLSPMRWDDAQFARGYDKWLAYGQSKTAMALFAVKFDVLAKARGIHAFSLHPGKIFTPLQRHLTAGEMVTAGWLDDEGRPADPTFKTVEQGAATQVWAATSPQLAGKGGLYCEDCDIAPIGQADEDFGVCEYACSPGEASRLWNLSLELTKLQDPFAG